MPEARADVLSGLVARAGLDRLPPWSAKVLVGLTALVIALAAWRVVASPAAVDSFESGGVGQGSSTTPAEGDEPETGQAAAISAVPSTQPPTPPATLVVHVVGAVLRPGLYETDEGSRVGEVIDAAGGFTGNAAERAVNLARPVVDGEQVVVLTKDEYGRAGSPAAGSAAEDPGWQNAGSGSIAPGGSAATPPSSGKVDVNRADAATLETLPGIGPVIAARIVEDRAANGAFANTQELLRVSGIGEKTLAGMADRIVIR